MSRPVLKNDRFLSAFTSRVMRSGLHPVTILALESGRPLALLAAQFVWLAQPALSLVWRPQQLAQWAHFLEEPNSMDTLIEHLESEK